MNAAEIIDPTTIFVKSLIRSSNTEENGHVAKTPKRVASMYAEILTPPQFEFTTFENTKGYDQVVLADGIRFYSLCAHHLLPFFGLASVAYIPKEKYVGLSKLARTVDFFARRLQVQEDFTQQIGDFLWTRLEPIGVGVVVRGRHLCMEMRGVESPGTITTTSFMRGAFMEKPQARAELLDLIKKEEPL